MSESSLSDLIAVAAGRRPADLVLRNAQIVNVVSHEIYTGDLAITAGRIVGVGPYSGSRVVDIKGRYICPGFIDAHVHIESSMLSVPDFARLVVAHGTTAVVADPHEFANVMGTEGLSFLLRTAKHAPIDVYVMLSSCVPASPFECGGTELSAEDLEPFLGNPWVLGLAEVMNYPGVIAAENAVMQKLHMARDRIIDGHAPGLSGPDLTAYAAAGIMSDHECITAEEAAAKLREGLHIMVREGSQARNLAALLPLITPATADRFMFCTDDKKVQELRTEGQIDHIIRTAIRLGLDPILALRVASHSPARYFGLRRTGAILPGYRADLVVLDDLASCRVHQVFRHGELIAENGTCLLPRRTREDHSSMRSSINVHWIEPKDLEIAPPPGGDGSPPLIHVIQVLEHRIDTERLILPAAVENGQLVADPARDLAKIVVIERHRASGEIGRGFVKGFNLRAGAIASSVAHDAHNLIVVGMNDADMLTAIVRLIKLQGGFVAARDGRVLADVALPIAGLVSNEPAETLAASLDRVAAAARDLGCTLDQPFMAMSFLSLSVIGKLKITTKGLVDVEAFRAIPLFAGGGVPS